MSKQVQKWFYYSVTRPVSLNGQKRMPCVCYELSYSQEEQFEKLSDNGVVTLYTQRMRFRSGAAYPADTVTEDKPVIVQSSSASMDTEFAAQEKS